MSRVWCDAVSWKSGGELVELVESRAVNETASLVVGVWCLGRKIGVTLDCGVHKFRANIAKVAWMDVESTPDGARNTNVSSGGLLGKHCKEVGEDRSGQLRLYGSASWL